MMTDTVNWFNDSRGFGFITPEDCSKDVFVHFSAIVNDDFCTLAEDQKATFDVKDGQMGSLADNVKILCHNKR